VQPIFGVALAVGIALLGAFVAWGTAQAQDINQIGRYHVESVTIDMPGAAAYSTAVKIDTTSGQVWRWDGGSWVDMNM
jgi:hypothetical protein